ncbi:MAG: hypothetical protein K8T20_03865 [Planctomycetes bacterium]|nr:hypothetical protein [Planctomycetota bacterium]
MNQIGVLVGQGPASSALLVKLTPQPQRGSNGGHLKVELDPLLLLSMLDEKLKNQGSLLATALGGLRGVEVEFSLVLSADSLTQLASREPVRSFLSDHGVKLVRFQVERSLVVADWESASGAGRSVFIVRVDPARKCLEIEIERTSIGLERSTWPEWVSSVYPNVACEGSRLTMDFCQFAAVSLESPPASARLNLRGSIDCLIPFLRYFF